MDADDHNRIGTAVREVRFKGMDNRNLGVRFVHELYLQGYRIERVSIEEMLADKNKLDVSVHPG